VVTGYVESMSRRGIAGKGARFTFGILALTAVVALLQIVSSNRADSDAEGSWIMPGWVYEEEVVVIQTVPIRVSATRVIQVPVYGIDHHWHPLAIAGWSLPPVAALLAFALAIRRRNDRFGVAGARAALVVLAAAYFISPLVAWDIGPSSPDTGQQSLQKSRAEDMPALPRDLVRV
jgi:hypothetical protein